MKHRLAIRVYYEDTDFTGIVYHANHLRFAERGRTEFLRAQGLIHSVLLKHEPPLAFVVRNIKADFLKPAHIDDELIVETYLDELHGPRLEMKQAILRGEQMIWRADVCAAVISVESGKPIRPPAKMMESLTQSIYKG